MGVNGETVTIVHPGSRALRSGDTVPDWDDTTTEDVAHVAVAPGSSDENNDRRSGTVVGLTLYLPPGTDIDAADRVIVRGDTYEVDGDAGDWRSPFTGWRPGIEVAIKKADG